jgi:uncharacterized protein YdcH (DUF465 family)
MKIDFVFNTKYGELRDSIEVDETLSDEEIEAMKQQRLNNWLAVVKNGE